MFDNFTEHRPFYTLILHMEKGYKNRAMTTENRLEKEVSKSRRRVHDAVNKCTDVKVLDEAADILKRSSANGSASGSYPEG